MSYGFSEQDRYDLREIFRIFDFSKVEKVDDVVADAEKKGTTPTQLFDSLYALYKIQKLPQREAVAKRLHMAVTIANDADVESVLRQTEMKGFSERDAVRSLERKYSVQRITCRTLQDSRNGLHDDATGEPSELQRKASQLRHVTVNENSTTIAPAANAASTNKVTGQHTDRDDDDSDDNDDDDESSVIIARPPSHLSAAPTRENLDEIMSEEVREWLARMLGDSYNSDVLAMPNFIDALRNGVLLHVLLQKMQEPPVADADLKLPKRTTGFFIRDNVATFLKEAKKRFNLVDAQLFTDSDLVDGKSDRQVVTCLMAMARIAYSAGTIKIAPNIVMYEHEIEQQGNKLTKTDIDRIVKEAEAIENDAIPALQRDGAQLEEKAEMEHENADEAGRDVEASLHSESPCSNAAQDADLTSAAEANAETTPAPSSVQDKAAADGGGDGASKAEDETPQKTIPQTTSLDISSPTIADRTLSPTKSKNPGDNSATPDGSRAVAAAPTSLSPAPDTSSAAEQAAAAPAEKRDSPRPVSEELHTPQERGISPGEGPTASSTPNPSHDNDDNDESKDVDADAGSDADADKANGDGSNEESGSGRVFYLRDGALRPSRPTPEEEAELQEKRRKSAPRVVWKSPSSPLAATKPPRYHSRHWDGIDVVLGRHLNEHYEAYSQSPWRFHMVASTSGEYVLYNRQNAQKRVVYLRIIQTRLFLRNAGKNQPWLRFEEALANLENST